MSGNNLAHIEFHTRYLFCKYLQLPLVPQQYEAVIIRLKSLYMKFEI